MKTKVKQSILFISPYPNGIGPSQRFRFEQYLKILEQEYNCEQKTFWDKKSWDHLFSDSNFVLKTWLLILAFAKRKLLIFSIQKYDVIFIHREMAHIGPPIFEWIIKYVFKKKIIYDFDDAIWVLNYSDKNKIAKYFKSPWKIKYLCKWADTIIVGNTYLQSYAKQFNSNVVVIPTTIDTNYHKASNQSPKEKITIGWTGTLTTLRQLEIILPALKELEETFDFDFIVISNENPKIDLKSYKFIKWCKTTEIEDLLRINIGVMPLFDEEWEKGKCGFKGLQYMALEIPTIMSPVGVNTEIITDGVNGFLASTKNEWVETITKLINNSTLRITLGKAGRQTILEKYSVEANKQKYLDVFKSVLIK